MKVWRYIGKQRNGWWSASCWTRGLAHYANVVRRTRMAAEEALRPLARVMRGL